MALGAFLPAVFSYYSFAKKMDWSRPFNRSLDNPYALALHYVSLVVLSWAASVLVNLTLPPALAQAGHWQFLTNISLAVTIAYNVFSIATYATGSPALFNAHRYLHTVATVLELTVTTVYWPLRLWFLPLIMTKGAGIPLVLDLAIHAAPTAGLLVDFYLFSPNWQIHTRPALTLVTTLAFSYWLWLSVLMGETSVYPYPFLDVNTGLRVLIFVCVSLVAFSHFLIHRFLHSLIEPKQIKKE